MITSVVQFNGTMFNFNGSRSSWDGAKAGYHFVTYVNDGGKTNFRVARYSPIKSFYSTRHCNTFKLIFTY